MKESFDLESNRWDQGKGKNKEGDKGKGGDATGSSEAKNPQVPNAKTGCDFCGLKNHATGECKRRNACELCGFNNHGSYECRREPLWSLGPELCAAQVFNQSFFFIDEHIDMKAVRDKANTAIITVTSGELSARQLEIEFMSIVNDNVWRWSAKQVADNKFVMRFPNAKMVQDFSRFNLGMKSVNAQISIEPWSSALGAKGKLQSAWFKVRGIPSDQRSIRTIAKVGGLVGKTIKIDENTRFNNDFVRINIACRDIYEVPESAESALSLFIYDFFYELEEPEQGLGGKKSQGVKVDQTDMQPSPKKQKVDGIKPSAGNETPKKDGPSVQKTGQYGCSANMNIPGHIKYTQSAPAKSKVGEKRSKPEDKFVLKDGEDEEEIIPAATYEPGESSEEKQNMEDEGSENDIAADGGTENVWLAQCDTCIDEKLVSMNDVGSKKSSVIISEIDEKNECQESGQDEVNGEKDGGQMLLNMENLVNPCAQMAGDRDKRRWSERVHKRMEGRLEAVRDEDGKMLPGLSNVEVQGKILDGVKILLACAHRVLARQQAPPLLQAAPGDDAEAEEDQ